VSNKATLGKEMIRVCPNPIPWNEVYQRLSNVSHTRPDLPKPPIPLILNGWVYSNDAEKMQRWADTVIWARNAHCDEIVQSVSEDDFYFTEELTSYEVGPLGGPIYRSWDFSSKSRPEHDTITLALERLADEWSCVADGFSSYTKPLGFTGAKARRLVVGVSSDDAPPWGAWDSLSDIESKRRIFTAFRQAVNQVIKPLEVDHIDFIRAIANKKALTPKHPNPALQGGHAARSDRGLSFTG
jgi:hypothetical protein